MSTETYRDRFLRLKLAQKRRRGVPAYTLWINRPVGRAIAAAAPPGVTPNQLTAVGAVLTYGALLWLLFLADGGLATAGIGVLLVVGFFFDSADGQLARLRSAGSLRGEWLDHLLDSGRIALLHLATFAFLIRTQVLPPALAGLVCGVFLVAATLIFFGGILYDKLAADLVGTDPTAAVQGAPPPSTLRSALMLPLDYGFLCAVYVLVAWPVVFCVAYVLLSLVKLLACGAFLRKWYGQLSRLDRSRSAAAVRVDAA